MESLSLTAFLLIAFLQGAMGATKGLGETCTTSDTCTSTPKSVCDNVVKKCLIKQGQSCSGAGFSGMCVSGAECSTSNICTCKTFVYTAAATGLCTTNAGSGLYGLACTSSGGQCSDASVECVADVCVCVDDKAVDIADGTCSVTIASAKVGKVCTNDNKATTCGAASTNLECPSAGGVCNCATGYFGPFGGDCSAVPGNTGGGCLVVGDCTATDNTCTSNVCKAPLGGTCTVDTDCLTPADMDCDDLTKKCSLKTGQTCNTPVANKDKCVSGATCNATTNNCKCIATPTVYTDTLNLCKAVAGKVTGDCKTGSTCDHAYAECETTSNRCICKTGYTLKVADATCEKSGAISVIASALTVMLVAASGRLFSLH